MADDVLVSTDWVAQNLDNPKVKLVEVDVDTTQYDEGHAPGGAKPAFDLVQGHQWANRWPSLSRLTAR